MRRVHYLLLYACLIAAVIAGFMLIDLRGAGLTAPPPSGQAPFGVAPPPGQVDMILHVLLALVVVILAARLAGWAFRRFHQPPVIGEVLAGILLGPSLLGRLLPEAQAYLFPPSVVPHLAVLAQVGIIIYMFLVGTELDPLLLRRRTHTTVLISHTSIVVPFLLGAALALHLYPRLSSSDVPFTAFALFLGVSMSVTAFPVLARILTDRELQQTPLGVVALTCAAVDDVTAWCLLAFLVSIVQARMGSALATAALAVAYVVVMFTVVRPLVGRLLAREDKRGLGLRQPVLAGVCLALLLSSLITEFIGIHAIFGAFLLGVMVPAGSRIARELRQRLEDLILVLFLPAFFAFTGLRTQIGLVQGVGEWLTCGLIILVACLGKFGGSSLAARVTGLPWREAACLGILMNTRGLMELVVLNIGLDLKVISPTLFAMLVIMALVTTFLTTPILDLLRRGAGDSGEGREAPPPTSAGLSRAGSREAGS